MKKYIVISLVIGLLVLGFYSFALPEQNDGDEVSVQVKRLNDRLGTLEARIFALESRLQQGVVVKPAQPKHLPGSSKKQSLEERVKRIEDSMEVRVYLLDQ